MATNNAINANQTTPLASVNGGTGVSNASTITIGGALVTTPANAVTFTTTGATNVTLPTSGTLATTAQIPSTPISLANGGTGASLTADNGGIFYSNATTGAILGSTSTANQPLLSGASGMPGWSTATYPGSTTANQLLYSSANNTITGLATANSAVLATDGSGVPSITATPTVTSITFGAGTALSSYVEGTFTPTMVGASTAGTTTYTTQAGFYTRVGNLVTVCVTLLGTAATGTGDILFGNFPFTVKNQTNGNFPGAILSASGAGFIFPAGTTMLTLFSVLNTTTAKIYASGTATNGSFMQMANAAFNFQFTVTYQI